MSDEKDVRVWAYGPNGEAEIFEDTEAVPKGWVDSPAKVKPKEKSGE